jgi:hypothetical protein
MAIYYGFRWGLLFFLLRYLQLFKSSTDLFRDSDVSEPEPKSIAQAPPLFSPSNTSFVGRSSEDLLTSNFVIR